MKYISTRGNAQPMYFDDVLLSNLAPDGGLYMPDYWPEFSKNDWALMGAMPYAQLAMMVINPFLDKSFPRNQLMPLLQDCYPKFNHPAVAPLVQLDHHLWLLELYHGPTFAFKDYALQLLGRMMEASLLRRGEQITIVAATSGDTGSAAIEAFRGRKNIRLFVLHPHGKVSDVQRRQMTTVDEDNIHNIAIHGNFDDCQDLVKAIFNDQDFNARHRLGAVNSINWVRILAQIVYYASSVLSLSGGGNRPVNIAVPTGNFGNILAAWAGRKMGLPIDRLMIASNQNDILTRFIQHNDMSTQGVKPSVAPSMDIQISSNFERYLFELLDRDGVACANLMSDFRQNGRLNLDQTLWKKANQEFQALSLNDDEIVQVIRDTYEKTGYLVDPHTATAIAIANQSYAQSDVPIIVAGTAHPCKFPDVCQKAIGHDPQSAAKLTPPIAIQKLFGLKEKYQLMDNDLQQLQKYIESN